MERFNNGIIVKQKIDVLERVTGCERSNVYEIFRKDNTGKQLKGRQFKCKEKSNCCSRNCLSPACRPLALKMINCTKDSEEDDEICMVNTKECSSIYTTRQHNLYLKS